MHEIGSSRRITDKANRKIKGLAIRLQNRKIYNNSAIKDFGNAEKTGRIS